MTIIEAEIVVTVPAEELIKLLMDAAFAIASTDSHDWAIVGQLKDAVRSIQDSAPRGFKRL